MEGPFLPTRASAKASLEASRRTQASGDWYARLRRRLQSIETLPEKCQHHDLVGSEIGVLTLELLRDLGLNHLHEVTGHVGVQDFRVDVALAADGRRVAELLRDAFDRGDDVALRLGLAVVRLEFRKRQRRQNGSRPSPKILGAEVLARNVLDVAVD